MSSNSHREDSSVVTEDNSSDSESSSGSDSPSSGGVSSYEEEPSSGEVPSLNPQDDWPHPTRIHSALLSHLGLIVRPRILNEDNRPRRTLYRGDEGLRMEEETSEDEDDSDYVYRDWHLEAEE